MKPIICEACIIKPICTKTCREHTLRRIRTGCQALKLRKKVVSKNDHRRKNVKRQLIRHYNALVYKYDRYTQQAHQIRVNYSNKHYGGESLILNNPMSTKNRILPHLLKTESYNK